MQQINKFFLSILFLLCVFSSRGQSEKLAIEIKTAYADWLAKPGDKVVFDISIQVNGQPFKGDSVSYEIGPEMVNPFVKEQIRDFSGHFKSDAFTLKKPGFLRCTVVVTQNGKQTKKLCTIGFSPEKIVATQHTPNDFDSFWDKAISELKSVPMLATKTLLPDKSTVEVDVFRVSFNNIGNSKIYGILSVPSDPGKYPAVLRVPGAGVRPYGPEIELASKGMIVLSIGIHGIPVDLDSVVYKDLAAGALRAYYNNNLQDKDQFYYKRVYLGCIRANDYLSSLPEWDGKNLIVMGGSQGGALSIVTTALDKRVTAVAALYPALSDVTGYLHHRAGGWPHYFAPNNYSVLKKINGLENTLSYYDVVNFAKGIRVPGFYSWGFNDVVCPPTSMYASYNGISAPKVLRIYKETGHWTHPDQKNEWFDWIRKQTEKMK